MSSWKRRTIFLMTAVAVLASVSAAAGELVVNGGFELANFGASWVDGAGNLNGRFNPAWADHAVLLDMPYSGSYSAILGFKYTNQRRNRFGFIYQDVTIPSNISRATLYFRFRQQGYDGSGYDPFRVEIRDQSGNTLANVVTFSFNEWNNLFKDSGWIDDDGLGPRGYDMSSYAGSTVRLYFRQENDYDNLYETWTYVDDVSLVYRKFVDLAVDGDGDDLFGAVGSGEGGYSVKSCTAGDTICYSLRIENEGLDDDSYTLSIGTQPGWGALIRYNGSDYTLPWTTPVITAGSFIEAQVVMAVPVTTPTGSYTSIVDAVSTANANRYDSVKLDANVLAAHFGADIAIDSDGFGVVDPAGGGGTSLKEAPPDSVLAYLIDIHNAGNVTDSFLVWFDCPAPLTAVMEEGAVQHSGPFLTESIAAGAASSMVFRVTVPANLRGGDYTSLVHARSVSDTLEADCVTAASRIRAPAVDVVIDGSGDGIVDDTGSGKGGSSTIGGTRGSTVYFPLNVQNEGAVVDSFALSWVRPGNGWSAAIDDGTAVHPLPWTTEAFAALSSKNYYLALSIPAGAGYGTYASILNAASLTDGNITESVSANISVSSGNETDLMIDGDGDNVYGPAQTGLGGKSSVSSAAGDTVYFSIRLQNESGENLFDVDWIAPDGWEVSIGDSISSMHSVPEGVYTMMVVVPSGCTGGTFEVITDAKKSNKPYFVDSVKGIIVVAPRYLVDALIDGNGEDAYGSLGSGSGGSSTGQTSSASSLSFAIDLENKGGAAEAYLLTWNSIPGWSASLEGSSSPYTTVNVEAGSVISLSFDVDVPANASEGDYAYVIDIVSTVDSTNVESITAIVHVNPPPRADLVIDSNGALKTAPWASGEGGRAVVFGDPGDVVTVALEVNNIGGVCDSFLIDWSEPDGWPAGSVVINDGISDHSSSFKTDTISAGASKVMSVIVNVPAGAAPDTKVIINGKPVSNDLYDSVTLEVLTQAFLRITVFDDSDHDASFDVGEEGLSGVSLSCSSSLGIAGAVTNGDGVVLFRVPGNDACTVIETTPSGCISLSKDTVDASSPSAGDTLDLYFADVKLSTINTQSSLSAPSGGIVDLPHIIKAGTPGQASLSALLPQGWTEIYYRDNNGNGVVDAGDTRLTNGDLDLDPDVSGRDVVPIVVRTFIPPYVAAGSSVSITFRLEQLLSGTSTAKADSVSDRVTVLARASGLLKLVKLVDHTEARPGDTITYTIVFSNPGTEGVREIEIIDPISPLVELVTDSFGAAMDIEWIRGVSTVYLTADPNDADEAMYDASARRLRIVLSRQSEHVLASGAEERIIYRVRIK